MMKTIIIGLPRTGTSIIYKLFCIHLPNSIRLYEPFNDGINLARKRGLEPRLHDTVQVDDDFRRLPRYVQDLILSNIWFVDYLNTRVRMGGERFLDILRTVARLGEHVIIKDIYVWARVLEQVDEVHELGYRVIAVVRDREAVWRDLEKWVQEVPPVVKRLGPVLEAGICYHNALIAFGLQLAHIELFGYPFPLALDYTLTELRALFDRVYSVYLMYVQKHADYVLSHDDLCSSPEKVIREIAEMCEVKPRFEASRLVKC